MQAVVCAGVGGPEVLQLGTAPMPEPAAGQLLVRVTACALNRADLLQRQGRYPPPPGESAILGLELAGEVARVGASVEGFRPGDRVFGLVGGGAYAQYALLDAQMAMPIPAHWRDTEAAAVPEVFFTAGETLFTRGELQSGERVLIHAGGSGVGTAAIQLARAAGAQVYATVGSAEKITRCVALGATAGLNYKQRDFAEAVMEWTAGEGVDLIEDFVGGGYLDRNLRSLRPLGRLIVVGVLGGVSDSLDFGLVLRKRLTIRGFALRSQTLAEKRAITRRFVTRWLPRLAAGELKPVIDTLYPVAEVAAAHTYMAENRSFGKIVLDLGVW